MWAASTQNLANTAWAFATLDQQDAQLFMELAREAERRMGNSAGASSMTETAEAGSYRKVPAAIQIKEVATIRHHPDQGGGQHRSCYSRTAHTKGT